MHNLMRIHGKGPIGPVISAQQSASNICFYLNFCPLTLNSSSLIFAAQESSPIFAVNSCYKDLLPIHLGWDISLTFS